jgi:hypothetical protein
MVVNKEEDPNFECHKCNQDLELESSHSGSGHKAVPVHYLIEHIIKKVDERFLKAEDQL